MNNRLAIGIILTLFAFSSPTVEAGSFSSDDFELVVVGYDYLPPHFDPDFMSLNYEVWIVNNSGQTIVFDEDLFIGGSNFDAQINGESIFDSSAYIWTQSALKTNIGDGNMDPGETYYLGGISSFFESSFLPNTSTTELSFLSILLRPTSSLNDPGFWVDYSGGPIVNTIMVATPVPAVGLTLIPLIVVMRLFARGRGPESIQAA